MKKKFAAIFLSAVSAVSTACFFAMNAFAEGESASETAQSSGGNSFLTFVLPLLLMFVLLYFMAIRPQKKQEQEAKQMQNSIQVGDEIVTNGGIVGMIVRVGDDNVVIETGGERNKIRVKKWAIAENVSATERAKQAQPKSKSPIESAGVAEDDGKKKKKSKKSDDSTEE
ncbi:MAG: preprotein translocase subunit YajC [Ruminococcus flavefaciens]|nr:preprotein translocase subunit YajC [Ruminococcus flavefaciens]MCM1228814.1 preprotein translocase subunit YajC [Ruminococcus flavefaciens]